MRQVRSGMTATVGILLMVAMVKAAAQQPAAGPAPARGVAAPKVLYSQNFEGVAEGSPVPESVVKDNTWTGDKTTYRIVQTNAMGGKALEIGVSSFAQMVFAGPLTVTAGRTYRISGTVAATGRKQYTILLRKMPAPYTAYVEARGTASEAWHRFDFIVRAAGGGGDAAIMMMVNGQGTFWLGDLSIEEYAGSPPAQEPPLRGNMVQNSSFELGWDGWLWRDESSYAPGRVPGRARIDETTAATGRRSVRLTGSVSVSCPYYPVAYGQEYTVAVRARADYAGAQLQLMRSGPSGATRTLPVPESRWGRLSFTQKIPAASGSVAEKPYAGVWIFAHLPAGKHLWIDDADLEAGAATAWAPRAERDMAITTDKPNGVVVEGQAVTLTLRSIEWRRAAAGPLRVKVDQADEDGRVVHTYDVSLSPATGHEPAERKGTLHLADLAPGYWRFTTSSGLGPADEGEALVAVVPKMPEVPIDEWQAGTHPSMDRWKTPPWMATLPKCGLRWARMHDVCVATKWPRVEPKRGDFDWAAVDPQIDTYLRAGYRVLGLLDGVPAWRLGKGRKLSWSAMAYPDRDLSDWERYVRETVGHWRGKIDAWEVMNEPVYAGKGPGGLSNAEWYVEMLSAAYRAAKEANPRAFIIGGGGAAGPSANNPWWGEAIKAGLFRHCDAVSYHGYGLATTQVLGGPRPLDDFMAWIHGQMRESVGHELPVWDTEVGMSPQTASRKFWLPNRGSEDPYEDARVAAVTLLCEREAGVAKTFYYAAFAYRLTEKTDLAMFSDINDQATPLAVSVAVANAEVEGLDPVRERQTAPGVTALAFRTPPGAKDPRIVWAVWTVKGRAAVELRVARRARVTAVDTFGRTAHVKRAGGEVTVEAGPRPTYVVAR